MLLWLADTLRNAGLPVQEIPGWQTRGHGDIGPIFGVVLHHTAGPAAGSYPSLRVVRDGRADLPGPLAQLGLARDGTWLVIAAGLAWHAGSGSVSWCPKDQGNQHMIGIEAESTGARDDWTPQQRDGYPRGVAALLNYMHLPASRAIGHKEWAPGRKVDPAFWDMDQFRATVASLMAGPPTPSPGVLMALTDAEQTELLDLVRKLKPGVMLPGRGRSTANIVDDAFGWSITGAGRASDALAEVQALRVELADLRATVARITAGGPSVDPAAFAAAVAGELAARLRE
jgi:hypothetical protein